MTLYWFGEVFEELMDASHYDDALTEAGCDDEGAAVGLSDCVP